MAFIPRTFGKYLLDEEIARGGMSRVFLARLRGLGGFEKRLVVKQVLPELALDPRFVGMFVQEAKTVVQMSHPHIVPVYELGGVDGVYFLAMEYVEGATLAALLASGPLDPPLATHAVAEVCDALQYAHDRFGIIHRDVTPRNVIIDAAGHSRLLDFGIAAPTAGAEQELFGTPGYLPPELLRGEPLGPASDLFALGCVLYEILTGRRAFPGKSVDATREALLDGTGPRIEPEDEVPERLGAIVACCLRREPSERYPSARAMGQALRSVLAASHPEGVADELARRAEAAHRDRRRRDPGDWPAPEGEGGPTRVRTLAASRLLQELLDAPAGEAATTVYGGDDAGEPATKELPTRRLRPDGPGERSVDDRAVTVPLGRPAGPGRRWALAAALVVVAAAAALVWGGRPAPVADEPRIDEPVARPPEAARGSRPPPEPVAVADGEEPPSAEPAPDEAPAPTDTPPPAAAPVSALSVNATPWAEVHLDGRSLGVTPQRRVPVRRGAHTLVLRCPPLGREARATLQAREGRPILVVADLSEDPPVIRIR
ncbi:MAG: serine/threonine-protein kinase [Sandaracinaceae bacterium]